MEGFLSKTILDLRDVAREVSEKYIRPHSERNDREARWPEEGMRALGDAGLLGLNVPKRFGGHEQGLQALAVISEEIGKVDPSCALCFGMHCVGTAVIAAKATPYQEENYLKPIAEGKHITTLALSESGSGAHFYFPETKLTKSGKKFLANGEKDFITNGGYADSYVVSTHISEELQGEAGEGKFNMLILDKRARGIEWGPAWNGFGMRGNSSRGMMLKNTEIPVENLLGEEGDQTWYVFEVVAPYFLLSMSGSYLGAAQGALDYVKEHLKARRYSHSGTSLSNVQALQISLADLWIQVEKTRGLIYDAGQRGDVADPGALSSILGCKADVADMAVYVVNEAMSLAGGRAYAQNSYLSRLLRDVRASHVMAPTTQILKEWLGRYLLGLPLL
ncbi:MAG: acyl-CoA/acyl-ACP dehydrogenase [Candidatus Colwellbacteria bacterium]|nr:acyl-CoA/acyl-ACP dehydrogenase [Candidatus Colwellbacteria bacterium]